MVRPCVARDFVNLADAVLHQCIRPLIGACVLWAIMDISAHAFSLTDRPRSGHSGHQCSHAPGRPILHLYLSSRRPRLETVCCYVIAWLLIPRSSFVRAKGRSFVPACRTSIASRAGAVKAGRRPWLAAGPPPSPPPAPPQDPAGWAEPPSAV